MDLQRSHNRWLMTTVIALALAAGCLADKQSFDCKMRQMAMDFARKIQPFRSQEHFQEIADALNGAQEAQNCNVSAPDMKNKHKEKAPTFPIPTKGNVFYVDANKGSNTNPGTIDKPFETIVKAIFSARAAGQYSTIILRAGTFYQSEVLELTSADKGLTIQNYPNEEVWISGGKVITPQWEKYDVDRSKNTNIYKATFSKNITFLSIPGLRVNNKRAIRARYPNADPELGFGSTLTADKWLPPTLPQKPDKEINPSDPFRNSSNSFTKYELGIGGPCKNFDPPAGYWCGTHIAGGGPHIYTVPSGMTIGKKKLPNLPYKNPVGAIIQAWRPGHWASWMFEVGSYNTDTNGTFTFTFSKGGFQGARGNEKGAEIVVENVMEELDAPSEWFYDEDSRTLYFFYNATSGTEPPSDTLFVMTTQQTLAMIQGNMTNPVEDITIRGINFRDTAYTYMDPHGMPSGGDWALERMGAIFLEGTKNVTIDSCIFEDLDGNGIMVSGYNRNTTITRNEFVWLGSTAIGQWGYTKTIDSAAPGMGWDGTDGNQPRFSNISYNLAHELGIWEKQSSFYTQAKSCQNIITNNIFFNGPRAGINFNDGFGGASTVTQNLLFNPCQESGSHGPFNSWDRQVYVTKVCDGTPSPEKDWDYIISNFMIANYDSVVGVDNDDGSAYYKTHGNFVAYSSTHPSFGGMKNDFGGHDNHHYNNIYAYVISGFGINSQLEGHEDYFYNNTVVMTRDGDYGSGTCDGAGKTVVHDNRIYSPTGKITECKMSLAEWQAKGNDPGTTAGTWPDDSDLEAMVRWLLNI